MPNEKTRVPTVESEPHPDVAETSSPADQDIEPEILEPREPPRDGDGQREVVIHARWQGPLPPPELLAGYDKIVEGGAERVFQQFEAEGNHRRAMESAELEGLRVGKFYALIYVLAIITAIIVAIIFKYPYLAAAFLTTGVFGAVWLFVKGSGDDGPKGGRPPE